MWFKRKLQNRRHGREYVLGVRARTAHVRAARKRRAVKGLGILLMLVLVGLAGWGGIRWVFDHWVYHNDAFAIREFDLCTNGILSVDQLRHWTGIKLGDNILALDLARVKRDLEMIPWVDSASVERILPRTLRIRVFEREPVARLHVPRPAADGGIELVPYYISSAGYIMLPLDPRQLSPTAHLPEPLPLLGGGLNPDDLQPGRRINTPQVAAALRLLDTFDQSPMGDLPDLTRIDLSCPDVLIVTTDQGGEITFGLTDIDQQLRRWAAICERAQRETKILASLDLAVTNNIPARWFETNAAAALRPRVPRALHTRRNHA